jgi:hypothetical protein
MEVPSPCASCKICCQGQITQRCIPDLGQKDSNAIRYEDQEVRRSNTELTSPLVRKKIIEKSQMLYFRPRGWRLLSEARLLVVVLRLRFGREKRIESISCTCGAFDLGAGVCFQKLDYWRYWYCVSVLVAKREYNRYLAHVVLSTSGLAPPFWSRKKNITDIL